MATPQAPPGLSELTVTCRQCGAADMLRLDRKEYKCRHCGAITVVSDSDAGRLEQLLTQFVARQRPAPSAPPRRGPVAAVLGITLGTIVAAIALLSRHASSVSPAGGADAYFAQQSVPNDQVVISSLHWQPDSTGGGVYTGVLYNHSGYAIMPPSYTLNLFHDGMKGGGGTSLALLSTLEPGEYMPVEFRISSGQPGDRYEVEQPTHIMHSTMEVAPLPLGNPRLVHQVGSPGDSLVATVRNTLTRPVQGTGMLMLYGPDGSIVASGVGSVPKLTPGEQTIVTLNAFFPGGERPVVAYEYLLDTFYENTAQSVSLEEWQQQGKQTVPSRIHRVGNPQITLIPAGASWKPEEFLNR